MRISAAVADAAGATVVVGPQTRGRGFFHAVDAEHARPDPLACRRNRLLNLTNGAHRHG